VGSNTGKTIMVTGRVPCLIPPPEFWQNTPEILLWGVETTNVEAYTIIKVSYNSFGRVVTTGPTEKLTRRKMTPTFSIGWYSAEINGSCEQKAALLTLCTLVHSSQLWSWSNHRIMWGLYTQSMLGLYTQSMWGLYTQSEPGQGFLTRA